MAEKLLKKDMPGYHALQTKYQAFRSNGNLAPEWSDFWAFYNWAMEHGWKPGANIIADWTRPIGPGNCWIKITVKRQVPETALEETTVKGGSANSPCIGCPNDGGKGCASYTCCPKYRAWVVASWAQFNAYARKYGGRHG